jgi:hypothetical protein
MAPWSPRWFDIRPAFQALQPRNLRALLSNQALEFRNFVQQLHHKLPQFLRRQDSDIGPGVHAVLESSRVASMQAKNQPSPGLCQPYEFSG